MPESRTRKTVAVFVLASCLAAGQVVQLSPGEMVYTVSDYRPEITFRSNASPVQVEAVVRKDWQPPLDGLTQDDFEIRDDGVLQRIAAFEVRHHAASAASNQADAVASASGAAAAKPRYVMFFMDDLDTAFYGISNARRGALAYLKAGLPANEWIAVATSSGIVTQPFTQDRGLVETALNRIRPHPTGCDPTGTTFAYGAVTKVRVPDMRIGPKDLITASHCTGRGLARLASGESQAHDAYDAISEQLKNLARQPGDRVFLLASYGIFSADTPVFGGTIEHIADLAVLNHITINSLDTQGAGEILATAADLDVMSHLSKDTGGQLFFGNNAFDVGVRELVEPPAVAYLLSFAPTPLKNDGKQHKVVVSLTHRRGLDVSARDSYFAPEPDEPGTDALRDMIRQAVLDQSTPTHLPAEALATAHANLGVAVVIRLHTPSLPLPKNGDLHTNTVLAVAELIDAQGKPVVGEIGELRLRLQKDSLVQFQEPASAVSLKLTLGAPAGSYRLRIVVGEARTGLLSASNEDVVVP